MSRSSKQAIIGMAVFAAVLTTIAVISSRANSTHGLRVDVLSARRAEPGDPIDVTVSVRDTKGALRSVRIDYGDGSVDTPQFGMGASCATPFTQKIDVTHAFEFIGVSTITARVTTGGCGAERETVEAVRTIEIKPLRR